MLTASLVPQNRSQAHEQRGIDVEKALDSVRRNEDGREDANRVIVVARRGQQTLEEAACNFREKCLLGGQTRFREKRHRIK